MRTYLYPNSTFYGSVTVSWRAASAVIRREKRVCSDRASVFFGDSVGGGENNFIGYLRANVADVNEKRVNITFKCSFNIQLGNMLEFDFYFLIYDCSFRMV